MVRVVTKCDMIDSFHQVLHVPAPCFVQELSEGHLEERSILQILELRQESQGIDGAKSVRLT